MDVEREVYEQIQDIVARGDDVQIKQNKDGGLNIYSVRMRKTIPSLKTKETEKTCG